MALSSLLGWKMTAAPAGGACGAADKPAETPPPAVQPTRKPPFPDGCLLPGILAFIRSEPTGFP